MKKTVQLWIVALVVALCSTSLSAKTPNYLFFCIGDGMSFSLFGGARWVFVVLTVLVTMVLSFMFCSCF